MSLYDLSIRESAVLVGYSKGMTDAEIAAELELSPHTVHEYGYRIRSKLGARSRAHAVAIWVRHPVCEPVS